ncbi:hypothetical protein ACH0BF_24320 [Pseudobacillus sp. 179-B 2D1 NHS]|uniref:hypothetical protein n=2 Tax=unclassified Pseudobacillus TaxID=2619284 RepID=UPI003878FC2B
MMNISVLCNGKTEQVSLGLVKELTDTSITLAIGEEEILIQESLQTLSRVKEIIKDQPTALIPVQMEERKILLDAKVPEDQLLIELRGIE